jgi:hypothetical protein
MPKDIKNWCILTIVINAALMAIGTLVLRNLAPLLLFLLLTVIGPIYFLLSWQDLRKRWDMLSDFGQSSPLPTPQLPSLESVTIIILVGSIAAFVCILMLIPFVSFWQQSNPY